MEELFTLIAAVTENSMKHVELNLAAHEMLSVYKEEVPNN